MRFSEFFQKGIQTRPYWPSFKGMGAEFVQESVLYKVIFGLLALPLAIPLLTAINLAFWHFTSSRLDFPIFLKTIVFQIIVEICLILYVVLLVRDKKYAPFLTATHILLLTLGAVLAITGLFSLDAHNSFFSGAFRADGLIFLGHVGIYFSLLTWLIRDKIRLELLFKIAILCGIATLVFIVLIYASQTQKSIGLTWRQITQIILGNTGFFAHYLLILILINTYFLFTKPRVWNLIAAVLFACFAAITLSSTAVFLIFCLYVVLMWFIRRSWFYGFVLIGLGAMFYVMVFGNSFIAQILSPTSEAFVRGQIWKDAIGAVFTHNPLLGYGWGNNEIMWNTLAHDSWAASGDSWDPIFFDKIHNIFIEFLTASGIIGLVVFIIFWARILCRSLINFIKSYNRIWLLFFAVFLINLCYLLFNFDTLMSYVLISVVLAGFVLFCKEREYKLYISKKVGIAAAGIFILIGSYTLYHYNLKPFKVHALTYQAEAEMIQSSGAPFLKKQKILTTLDQARTVDQPYNLLLLDVAKVLDQLPDHLPLDAEENTQAYQLLQSIYAELNEKHPVNPYYYYKRAAIEKKFAFNLEASEQYLKKALELAPHKGVFRFYLAVVHLQQDKVDEAVKIFEQLSKEDLYPGIVDVFLALIDIQQGRLLEGQKKFTAALSFYDPTSLEWDLFTEFYLTHGDKQSLLAWYNRLLGIVGEDSYLKDVIASLK